MHIQIPLIHPGGASGLQNACPQDEGGVESVKEVGITSHLGVPGLTVYNRFWRQHQIVNGQLLPARQLNVLEGFYTAI